ncbi:MAG TPA: ATP-dependent DNA helicase [Chloroflexota bacterium]|jgi:DNA helicase-2/ATP-dependent DNA helicase PcrA|nr:ATP-dependent DNA helicase [Chloroflexota bacterium]
MRETGTASALNDRQRDALNVLGHAPLRVIAGPGTGKTTTVVEMYLCLVRDMGFKASEVLLLTFSANAAHELKLRIDQRLRESYDESWVSTFHSFAYRLATDVAPRMSPSDVPARPFRLMNGFQEKLLMRHVLRNIWASDPGQTDVVTNGTTHGTQKDNPLAESALRRLRRSDSLTQDALWFISTLKQELVRPDDFSNWAAGSNASDRSQADGVAHAAGIDGEKLRDLASIYSMYSAEQERLRLQDFRDVIATAVALLENDDSLCRRVSARFRYVIVDEFQDVDAAQVRLLDLLTVDHSGFRHLAVVGALDQSIYSFRGTSPAFIEGDWPFAGEIVHLRDNYRSVSQILDASIALRDEFAADSRTIGESALNDAEGHQDQTKDSYRPLSVRGRSNTPPIHIRHEENAADEASGIARLVRLLLRPSENGGSGYRPRDIAIILRSVRRSGRPVEEALHAAGVPHAVGVSPNFAASDVVRFGVAALRAIADERDDEQLSHVLQSPFCGVPPADASRLLAEAKRRRERERFSLKHKSLATVLSHACYLMADEDATRWPLPWTAHSSAGDRAGSLIELEDSSAGLTATPASISPLTAESEQQLDAQAEQAARLESAERSADETEPIALPRDAWYHLLTQEAKDAIHGFTARWLLLRARSAQDAPDVLAYRIFQDLGITTTLMESAGTAGRNDPGGTTGAILGPLRMFLSAITDFVDFQRPLLGRDPTITETLEHLEPALREYVDELELPTDIDDLGQVRLLTIHAAKGLEFPVVIIPGMAAGRLPVIPRPRTPLLSPEEAEWLSDAVRRSRRSSRPANHISDGGIGDHDYARTAPLPWIVGDVDFLREEARLGYVGATRARDLLVLSWADQYEDEEVSQPSAYLAPFERGLDTEVLEYLEAREPATYLSHEDAPSAVAVTAFLNWQAWNSPLVVRPTLHESASSLNLHLGCPRKYFYGKLLKLRKDAGQDAARGTAFHEALQEFHEPKAERTWKGKPDLAREIYAECCANAMQAYLELIDGELQRQAERRMLQRLFDHYRTSEEQRWQEQSTIVTEAEFSWQTEVGPRLNGRIDRVIQLSQGRIEIVDYKTGSRKFPREVENQIGLHEAEGKAPTDIQLLVYYYAGASGEQAGLPAGQLEAVTLLYPKRLMGGKRASYIPRNGLYDGEAARGIRSQYINIALHRAGLLLQLEEHIAEARSGVYRPVPKTNHYTCTSPWGTGCEFEWLCPGRLEDPEEEENAW